MKGKKRWVTKYRISFSDDGINWASTEDCRGNIDDNQEVTNSVLDEMRKPQKVLVTIPD